MSGFLTGIVSVVDHLGNRVDTPNEDGDHSPVELQLGPTMTASATQNGSLKRITIDAAAGGGGGGGSAVALDTHDDFRALAIANVPDGQVFTFAEGPDGQPDGPYVYSTTDGAGELDDDRTTLKLTLVSPGAAGRAYNVNTSPILPTWAALGLATSGKQKCIHVQNYATPGDGGGGIFDYDASDTTTSDNGGTVRVAGSKRHKRRFSGAVHVTWFGAATGVSDCATAFTAAANASRHVLAPPGTYALPSGWTVPRAGVTIELLRGAVLNVGASIVTNHTDVHWLGNAFGRNLNSDGLNTWRPNILWTGTTGVAMKWADGATADACCLEGIFIDGGLQAGFTAFQIGTAGFGCSGYQWGAFGAIDAVNGINFRAACESSGFHQPYFTMREGSIVHGTLGVGIGSDAAYDGGITAFTFGDWGGIVQGFTTQIQVGGTAGRAGTVKIGGAKLTLEGIKASGLKGIYVYDAFHLDISGLHNELHGELIVAVANTNPIQVTTNKPHGIPNGRTVKTSNILGLTAANGSFVLTSTGTNTFTVPVNGVGQPAYSGGGLVADLTDPHKGIVIGNATTHSVPESVTIHGNYIAGTQYPIEGVNWDALHVFDNMFELSASGDNSHLPYAFHAAPDGGGRQVEGNWGLQRKISRGAFYGGDLSSRTGWAFALVTNKTDTNDIAPEVWTSGTFEGGALRNVKSSQEHQFGIAYTIGAATGNAVSPIVVTFTTTHQLRTGDQLHIEGETGNPAMNGDWPVHYVSSDQVSLDGSTGNGAFAGGSTIAITLSGMRQKYGAFDVTLGDSYNPSFRVDNGIAMLLRYKHVATAGTHPVLPGGLNVIASTWAGVAVDKQFLLEPVISQDNPLIGGWEGQVAGASCFAFDNMGQMWPAGRSSIREVYGTGAAPNTAAPDGTDWAIGDTWVRTDVSPGGISRWRCTTAGHTGSVVWKAEATLAA